MWTSTHWTSFGNDLCVLWENSNIKCSFHRHTYVIWWLTVLWHHLFHVVNIVIQSCFLFSGMLLQLAFISWTRGTKLRPMTCMYSRFILTNLIFFDFVKCDSTVFNILLNVPVPERVFAKPFPYLAYLFCLLIGVSLMMTHVTRSCSAHHLVCSCSK